MPVPVSRNGWGFGGSGIMERNVERGSAADRGGQWAG